MHSMSLVARHLGRYRCASSYSMDDVSLKYNDTGVSMHMKSKLFCGILSRSANLAIRGRRDLVTAVHRLTSMGGRCSELGYTLSRIRTANCKVIVPSVSRLALRRPRLMGRNNGCKIGLSTDTPSVRVLGTGVGARITPVINDRDRSRRLMGCLLRNFRRSPRGV